MSDGYPTLIDQLQSSGLIVNRTFAIYLNYLGNLGEHKGYGNPSSSLEIGTYNLSKYSTTGAFITNITLSSATYWQAVINKISFLNYYFANPNVIFDTGTTLIVTDTSSNFNSIYYILSELYGNCQILQGLIECSCKNATSLIGLNFTINNVVLTVPSNRLWDYDDGVCTLLVMASNQGFWILGDVFLNNYYMLYDMDTKVVKFAPAVVAVWDDCVKLVPGILGAILLIVS